MLGRPWASTSWGEKYIYSFFWVCLLVWAWDDVKIWLIDGAVRHMALRQTTEQLFGDWCEKGLTAMSTEKSHRTDPKALGPWVPTPCTTQWGSNCVQKWVVDIRITWILFWPGPSLISRLKFCSMWGAGSHKSFWNRYFYFIFYMGPTVTHRHA